MLRKMITDKVFIKELDINLKRQRIKKSERTKKIELYLYQPSYMRDSILDTEHSLAVSYEKAQKELRQIPLESEEQKALVAWFKKTYPDKVIMMIRNDGYRRNSEKAEQVLLGLHKGASDLYIPHIHTWVEMKRIKYSKVSDEQLTFGDYVVNECGDKFIIGYGFKDAREKIMRVINE